MDEPLQANSSNEMRFYLLITRCEACGAGPWEVLWFDGPGEPGGVRRAHAHCTHCRGLRDFSYVSSYEPADPASPCINPTDEPSRLIDLDLWLGLYFTLVDQAESHQDPAEAHKLLVQAALCLAEALKFYGPDDAPPESAFFSETTRQAFRRNPQSFTRQRLRDLQAKLPPCPPWPQET